MSGFCGCLCGSYRNCEEIMSSDDSSRETIRAAREIARECKSIVADFRKAQRAHWNNMAGSLLVDMLKSRENAERCLTHSDPLVRIASIEVLAHEWRSNETLASYCKDLVFNDPDSRVRGVAVNAFACCYRGTDDRSAGRILASIVRDELQPAKLRSGAYQGLFMLRHGKFLVWDGIYASPPADFPFPDKVDWTLVDSYLQEQ